MNKNQFVFVAPMFNASATLERMLHSLFGQSYDDWRLILIDDVSDPDHLRTCDNIINRFHTHDYRKIELIKNKNKLWEVANVLEGISRCADEDIICRIDADDWLIDLDALYIINEAYNKLGCEALWTAHRWSFSDNNISGYMKPEADPYKHKWVSSHLKTFRKRLLNNVNDENYRGSDGEYIKRCGDQAIYLPVLHQTQKRHFLPRAMYHYTIKHEQATYQSADANFQREEGLFLRERGFVK